MLDAGSVKPMNKDKKSKLRRFVGFSICNAPGTAVELLTLWLLSDILFHTRFTQFFLAPILAFECSIVVDFTLFSVFVWRENIGNNPRKGFLKRLLMFNISTAGVYLLRFLLIQVLHWLLGLGAVTCDLISMLFSGLLNFGINDRIIFAKDDGHRTWVRLLMSLVRPFATLRIEGQSNLPDDKGPVVYVCNHGFFFGPVAAVLNLPGSFRPWIDSCALNAKECYRDLNRIIGRKFRMFGRRFRHKVVEGIAHRAVIMLNDFNPIPVFKNGSRGVVETLKQSVDALVAGENLLIFPEHPRKNNRNIHTERRQASHLRTLYNGFAKLGQDFYNRTGETLRFIPVYINKKRRTMSIAPAVAYCVTGDAHSDRMMLAERLYSVLASMSKA